MSNAIKFSSEQQDIINAPLCSCSVIACAGSGKTLTAVHRLYKLREILRHDRTRIALLSFTNVAVETFKSQYSKLIGQESQGIVDKVDICTFDSFLIQNVLLPHGYLVMGCSRRPFLVNGNENFLKNILGPHKISLEDIRLGYKDGIVDFIPSSLCDKDTVVNIVKRMGKIGAYSHELGRLWVYCVLKRFPCILRALTNRYKYIIVDEAQDISIIQSKILLLLQKNGVTISLIGDPMQAIFEFSGADGKMLKAFDLDPKIRHCYLSQNFRSSEKIQEIANFLSGRHDKGMKISAGIDSLLFTVFEKDQIDVVVNDFKRYLDNHYPKVQSLACLHRGNSLIYGKLGSIEGTRPAKYFVRAMLSRDYHRNFNEAYKNVAKGFFHLMDSTDYDSFSQFSYALETDENFKEVRKLLWDFVRNIANGLPEWEPDTKSWIKKLKANIKKSMERLPIFLMSLDKRSSRMDALSHSVTIKNLDMTKIISTFTNNESEDAPIPKHTVHQVKGDEFDAVLYLMTSKQLKHWKKNIDDEEGRINYVALTRAKSVFCAAIPKENYKKYATEFLNLGFKEVNFCVEGKSNVSDLMR